MIGRLLCPPFLPHPRIIFNPVIFRKVLTAHRFPEAAEHLQPSIMARLRVISISEAPPSWVVLSQTPPVRFPPAESALRALAASSLSKLSCTLLHLLSF